jgi:hypothetical protein
MMAWLRRPVLVKRKRKKADSVKCRKCRTSFSEGQMSIWYGWLWDAWEQHWEQVAQGETIGAAAHALGLVGDARGVPCCCQGLTGGGVPLWTPRTHTKASPRREKASGSLAAARACQRAAEALERGTV